MFYKKGEKNTFSYCFLLSPAGYPSKCTLTTVSVLTTEEQQFLLSPAANSWESRMPDSCRDLIQESTSSRPVVSSSSMSFCPSTHKGTRQENEMTFGSGFGCGYQPNAKKKEKPSTLSYVILLIIYRIATKGGKQVQKNLFLGNLEPKTH